jgi:hypothetical protein
MFRQFFRCPGCDAAVLPLKQMCAQCGTDVRAISRRGAAIAAVAGFVGLTTLFIGVDYLRRQLITWRESHLLALQNTPPLLGNPSGEMHATPSTEFAWIEKAMADCDKDASAHPDALYFLVTPLVPTNKNDGSTVPRALGQIGHSVTLVPSKDALSGLRDGSFALYRGQFVFAIMEPATKVTYEWKQTTGVSKFVSQDASSINSFIPGFQIEGSETAWAGSPAQRRSACYWVNMLVHT